MGHEGCYVCGMDAAADCIVWGMKAATDSFVRDTKAAADSLANTQPTAAVDVMGERRPGPVKFHWPVRQAAS